HQYVRLRDVWNAVYDARNVDPPRLREKVRRGAPTRALHDRFKRDQRLQRRASTQRVLRQVLEHAYLAVQSQVVQHDRLHEQVDVVGGRAARVHDIAVRAEIAELLMAASRRSSFADEQRTSRWVVNQEEGRSRRLIVAGPLTLAAAARRIVDAPIRRQGTITEHIEHQRLAD